MREFWCEQKRKIGLRHVLECSVNREAAMCGLKRAVIREEEGRKENQKCRWLTCRMLKANCGESARSKPDLDPMKDCHDPLLDFQLQTLDAFDEDERTDPMIEYASRSWVMLTNHHHNHVERSPASSGWCSTIGQSSKRPRARPKNTKPPISCSPQSNTQNADSLREAHETWNTARILSISSNDKGAAIARIRKSKRLLLLEEMEQPGHQ